MSISSVGRIESFEIGRVLGRMFGAFGGNAGLFIGLAMVSSGLPRLIGGLARASVGSSGATGTVGHLVSVLLSVLGSAVLEVAVTRAIVTDLAGDRPSFTGCLRIGIALIPPMIALGVVGWLGICAALMLLVVPGVMLHVAWSVAVPAYMEERIGLIASLGRSRALTRGAKWKIFLLLLVWWTVAIVLQALVALLSDALKAPANVHLIPFDAQSTPSYAHVLISSIVTPITSTVLAALQAAIYVELRDLKDGGSPDRLEAIFA